MEGSKVRLFCKVNIDTGGGSVQWLKGRKKINGKSRRYDFKNKGRKLVLRNLTKGDTGNYVCRDPKTRKKIKIFRVVVTGMCLFIM